MNRPPNPHRDEHRRLESLGNAAAGLGNYTESQRLWHQAVTLKAQGRAEVENQMTDAASPNFDDLTPEDFRWKVGDEIKVKLPDSVLTPEMLTALGFTPDMTQDEFDDRMSVVWQLAVERLRNLGDDR